MFRPLLCMAALLVATGVVWGADCRNAMDQASMNRCAGDDYRAADRELNAAYRRLMGELRDTGLRNKLRSAQRAWIQFRDRKCRFETANNEGGSIHPLVYDMCLTRLTRARTRELNNGLDCWRHGERCGM
jgi:uncharacterized protein YecT (DUF1311 family)